MIYFLGYIIHFALYYVLNIKAQPCALSKNYQQLPTKRAVIDNMHSYRYFTLFPLCAKKSPRYYWSMMKNTACDLLLGRLFAIFPRNGNMRKFAEIRGSLRPTAADLSFENEPPDITSGAWLHEFKRLFFAAPFAFPFRKTR